MDGAGRGRASHCHRLLVVVRGFTQSAVSSRQHEQCASQRYSRRGPDLDSEAPAHHSAIQGSVRDSYSVVTRDGFEPPPTAWKVASVARCAPNSARPPESLPVVGEFDLIYRRARHLRVMAGCLVLASPSIGSVTLAPPSTGSVTPWT